MTRPDPKSCDAMNERDLRDLRQAFGQFATGVTVVTTAGPGPEPIGITANSFTSVSLQPPMVLWSLSDEALSRQCFEQAGHFCVHVLTAAQREVSQRFACRGNDKFDGIDWRWGRHALPVLDEYAARFTCRTTHQYPIGDHIVFIGEVLDYDQRPQRPLVFHGGQYAVTERRVMEDAALQPGEDPPFSTNRRGNGG